MRSPHLGLVHLHFQAENTQTIDGCGTGHAFVQARGALCVSSCDAGASNLLDSAALARPTSPWAHASPIVVDSDPALQTARKWPELIGDASLVEAKTQIEVAWIKSAARCGARS